MMALNYWNLARSHYEMYIVFVTLSTIIHYFLFRKHIHHVFDPYFFLIIGNIFSVALVFFMYWLDDIKYIYFQSFVLTQSVLYIGFLVTINRLSRQNYLDTTAVTTCNDNNFYILKIKVLLFVSSVFYICSQLFIYYYKGIPIFRDSRLGAFENAGGLGFIERIYDVSQSYLLFSIIAILYLIYNRYLSLKPNRKTVNILCCVYLIGVFILINLVLSGSKSSFLVVCMSVFVFHYVFNHKIRLNAKVMSFWGGKIGVAILSIALLTTLLIIFIQGRGSDSDEIPRGILALAFRFASFGDIYVNAYIFDTINELQGKNPFVGLFGGFLSTFRLFPASELYTSIGVQFTNILIPGLDLIAGPNARHNVAGLHYFGVYFSILYSLTLGIGLAFARNLLLKPRVINTDIDISILVILTGWRLLSLDTDFEYALSGVASLLVVAPLIIFISRVIFGILVNKRCHDLLLSSNTTSELSGNIHE